ncbi:helix-turn-helix domain-containing protein [Sulfurimonas sp.]|uniref:winged helix-turn-helix transcriptional regulator n=1 Tax=Sulfurimonas sp. TaxID=2022749 RepID=UPI00260018CE|nr:helix-turn-helix domain-containing protein [Sulfurimonas sp.]
MYYFNDKEYKCSLEATMDVLNGKWRSLILWHLIEENHLINRIAYPEVPPRVEYEITEKGKTLSCALRELEKWGRDYLSEDNTIK